MDGQMNIFDFPDFLPEEKKEISYEECMNALKPIFGIVICEHDHKALCNRWHGGDEEIAKAKADLNKGFACSGCCYYCSESPQHGGRCKFECRAKE